MAEFRNLETGKVFSVPDSENDDIAALRSDPTKYEEIGGAGATVASAKQDTISLPATSAPRETIGQGESFLRGLGQGYTFGGAKYITGDKERYAQAEAENPKSYMAGDIASALLPSPVDAIPGMAVGRRGKTAANVLRSLGKMAGRGAIEAGARGAIDTEGGVADRALSALKSAGLGAAAGATLGAGVPVAQKIAKKALAIPAGVTKAMSEIDPASEAGSTMNRMLAATPEGEAERALVKEAVRQDIDVPGTEKLIKRELGPSPSEAAEQAVSKRKTDIGGYTKQLVDEQQQDVQRGFINDLSEMYKLREEVADVAHTGLKGDVVNDAIKRHVSPLKGDSAKRFQKNVFGKSENILEKVDEAIGEIRKLAKENRASPSAGVASARIEKEIASYRKELADAASSPYLGLGRGGVDPGVMSKTYIALDNIKRSLGNAQKKITGDTTSKKAIQDLYEDLRGYLEKPNIWGDNVSKMQKELNAKWSKNLEVSRAFESTYLRGKTKAAIRGPSGFDNISEVEGSVAERILSDPGLAKNAADVRNLQQWLDTTPELSEELVKTYADRPELQQKVARLKELRESVKSHIDRARMLAKEGKAVGLSDEDRALQALARSSGSKGTKGEINRLIGEDYEARQFSPERVRALQRGDEAYRANVLKKLGDVGPEYRAKKGYDTIKKAEGEQPLNLLRSSVKFAVPQPSQAIRRMQRSEEMIDRLSGKADEDAPKLGSRGAYEATKALWGDRIEDEENYERDPRLEAALRVDTFKRNTDKPKVTTY